MIYNIRNSIKTYWYVYLAFIIMNVIRIFNQTPLSHYKHQSEEYKIHFYSLWLGLWLLSGILVFFAILSLKNKNKLLWIVAVISILLALYYFVFPIYSYFEINKLDKQVLTLQHQADSLRKIRK